MMSQEGLTVTPLIKKTEAWVKRVGWDVNHLKRAAYWVKRLKPDADESLTIAALTHDVERGIPGDDVVVYPREYTDEQYNELIRQHSERSARIVGEFLKENGADESLISKVQKLIRNHEFGGDEEDNLIQAADSISFLETEIEKFIAMIPEKMTPTFVLKKFTLMFERIKLPEAKEIARPLYEKAIEQLSQAI